MRCSKSLFRDMVVSLIQVKGALNVEKLSVYSLLFTTLNAQNRIITGRGVFMFQETKTWTKNNSRMKYIPGKVVLREVYSALLICVYRMNHGITVIHHSSESCDILAQRLHHAQNIL